MFSLLKHGNQVYTEIVPNCKSATLQRIIKGKTGVDSVIHSWGYNGLLGFGYKRNFRVHHSKAQSNGIESFWRYAKAMLVKFKGWIKVC